MILRHKMKFYVRQLNQTKPTMHKYWENVSSFITWTPALDRLSSHRSKQLFKNFQHDMHLCMLKMIMLGIILISILVLLGQVMYFKCLSYSPVILGVIILCPVYHAFAIGFQLAFPKIFRSLYFLIVIMSLILSESMQECTRKFQPGTFLTTCNTVLFLLTATVYFHNSTPLLVVSCVFKICRNMFLKISLMMKPTLFPGNVPILSEV